MDCRAPLRRLHAESLPIVPFRCGRFTILLQHPDDLRRGPARNGGYHFRRGPQQRSAFVQVMNHVGVFSIHKVGY